MIILKLVNTAHISNMNIANNIVVNIFQQDASGKHGGVHYIYSISLNPSNAEATFAGSTRTQTFLKTI